jgi:hypothetical protein
MKRTTILATTAAIAITSSLSACTRTVEVPAAADTTPATTAAASTTEHTRAPAATAPPATEAPAISEGGQHRMGCGRHARLRNWERECGHGRCQHPDGNDGGLRASSAGTSFGTGTGHGGWTARRRLLTCTCSGQRLPGRQPGIVRGPADPWGCGTGRCHRCTGPGLMASEDHRVHPVRKGDDRPCKA